MAKPIFLYFGFFVNDTVGDRKSRVRLTDGPEIEQFNRAVDDLFGTAHDAGENVGCPIFRYNGILMLSLWTIHKQPELAEKVLELQQPTSCQVVEHHGFSTHFVGRDYLVWQLEYHLTDFLDVWRKWEEINAANRRFFEANGAPE